MKYIRHNNNNDSNNNNNNNSNNDNNNDNYNKTPNITIETFQILICIKFMNVH